MRPERSKSGRGSLKRLLGGTQDALGRPQGSPRRPREAPKTPWGALGTRFSRDLCEKACRHARRANFVRFFALRVLSRDSSDVHETSVLVGPKHNRSMFASHERALARASKKQLFRPRKSTLEAPKRRPGEPGTHQDRCAERPNHQNARRATENLAKERALERSNAVSSPWSRCKSAGSPKHPNGDL